MNGFFQFLCDPFGSQSNAPLSAVRLFLIIGLILMLLFAWGLIFREIQEI